MGGFGMKLAHGSLGVVHADARRPGPFGKLKPEGQTPLEKPVQVQETAFGKIVELFIAYGNWSYDHVTKKVQNAQINASQADIDDFLIYYGSLPYAEGLENNASRFVSALMNESQTQDFTLDLRLPCVERWRLFNGIGLENRKNVTVIYPPGMLYCSNLGFNMSAGTLTTSVIANQIGLQMSGGMIIITSTFSELASFFGNSHRRTISIIGGSSTGGIIRFERMSLEELLEFKPGLCSNLDLSTDKVQIETSDGPVSLEQVVK